MNSTCYSFSYSTVNSVTAIKHCNRFNCSRKTQNCNKKSYFATKSAGNLQDHYQLGCFFFFKSGYSFACTSLPFRVGNQRSEILRVLHSQIGYYSITVSPECCSGFNEVSASHSTSKWERNPNYEIKQTLKLKLILYF